MKNWKILSLLLVFTLVTTITFAQKNIRGNGDVQKDESRQVGDFTKIHVATGIDGFVKIGNENKIVLEADENILKHIKTEVKDGQLKVWTEKNIKSSKTFKAHITVKSIEALTATSGADLTVEDMIKGDKLACKVTSGADLTFSADVTDFVGASSSGADMEIKKLIANKTVLKTSSGSDIEIEDGTTDVLEVNASSSGDLEAEGFTVQNCTAKASSGSDINIHVTTSLTAHASSGGDINVKGEPKIIKKESSGGEVKGKFSNAL